MLTIKYSVNLKELDRVIAMFRSGTGPFWDNIRTRWAKRLSVFHMRRFQKNSAGGGDWAPLAASTRRAKAYKGRHTKWRKTGETRRTKMMGWKSAILVDKLGSLKKALALGAMGNLDKALRYGVRYGIGGGPQHGRGITIGELAAIHQEGNPGGHLPARTLITEPDAVAAKQMVNDVMWAAKQAGF